MFEQMQREVMDQSLQDFAKNSHAEARVVIDSHSLLSGLEALNKRVGGIAKQAVQFQDKIDNLNNSIANEYQQLFDSLLNDRVSSINETLARLTNSQSLSLNDAIERLNLHPADHDSAFSAAINENIMSGLESIDQSIIDQAKRLAEKITPDLFDESHGTLSGQLPPLTGSVDGTTPVYHDDKPTKTEHGQYLTPQQLIILCIIAKVIIPLMTQGVNIGALFDTDFKINFNGNFFHIENNYYEDKTQQYASQASYVKPPVADISTSSRFITKDDTRVFNGPSTRSGVIETIDFGEPVMVLEKRKSWVKVSYNDFNNNPCTGWVFTRYTSR